MIRLLFSVACIQTAEWPLGMSKGNGLGECYFCDIFIKPFLGIFNFFNQGLYSRTTIKLWPSFSLSVNCGVPVPQRADTLLLEFTGWMTGGADWHQRWHSLRVLCHHAAPPHIILIDAAWHWWSWKALLGPASQPGVVLKTVAPVMQTAWLLTWVLC